MKTAVEICRDFIEYAKSQEGRWSKAYTEILNQAVAVVDAAIESGELSRQLKAGDQMDTGMLFRGHKIILEMSDNWYSGSGYHYREDTVRKQFTKCMESRLEVW